MSDWSELREPWERLKWARRYWQTKTGAATTKKAAAASMGMEENTYSAYERDPDASKHTPMDHQRAIQFANKFKINWVWLLTGGETPFTRTPAQQRAVDIMSGADEADQERAADIIAAALKRA